MAQSDTSSQEKGPRSWGSSDHITSRIAWPLYIIFGQTGLLLLAFGFLAGVRSKGQIALGLDAAAFLTNNPQVKSFIFPLLANALSLFSSFLFAQAVRHAILVSLTRPLALSTLGYGMIIWKKSLIINRQYKWVAISGAVFLISLGQTPAWSSLFTPNAIAFTVPVTGHEFDLASPALQDTLQTLLVNNTITNYIDFSVLSFIDASGVASATAQVGYPALVDFGGYAHDISTRGISPIYFQDSATGPPSSPLIATNVAPLPASAQISDVSLVLSQQGLSAAVSCQGAALDDTSDPPLHRTSQPFNGGFTLWNVSTDCGGVADFATAVTSTADTLFMVGCKSIDNLGQQTFTVIIDGQGFYSQFAHVCTVTPHIQLMLSNYTGQFLQSIATDFNLSSTPVDAGPMAFAGMYALQAGFGYGQSGLRNKSGRAVGCLYQGIIEFTGTASAIKTGITSLSGNLGTNPSPNVLRTVDGTAVVNTVGYEYNGVASVLVLIPILLFGLLSIAIAIALVSQFYNRGIALSNADFDPNDPWLLMAAASAGGMGNVFHSIEDDDVEKGLSNKVMLGEINGRDGFVQV
ncbi:hypothetical protein C8F01DRAFT_1366973 [Mycena amicta]|nr:hypothetical protein C8F01DRAFT_1366973 [Mycena amicta]